MSPAEHIAEHRLQRATEALKEGTQLLQAGSHAGAVNRFYYAAFYAARALLAMKDVDSSRHSGVIELLRQHYVNTGQLSADEAHTLSYWFQRRQRSDYADFATVTEEEAVQAKVETSTFVNRCSGIFQANRSATG